MPQKDEKGELLFPIIFDACPNCGGKEYLFETLFDEERLKGKISDNIKSEDAGFPVQGQIADPTKPSLSFPITMSILDICLNCGTVFAKMNIKGMAQAAPVMPNSGIIPPGSGLPNPGRFNFRAPPGLPPNGNFRRG